MITARLHPSDAEHAIEREALTIAVMNGPAVLTRHGLKRLHFSSGNAPLFHLVDVAARETDSGIPEIVRIWELASNEADSGIPQSELAATMAALTVGTGNPTNVTWYVHEIMAGHRRREDLRLTDLRQRILHGEVEGDLGEITRKQADLARADAVGQIPITIDSIRGCMLTGDQLTALSVPQRPRLLDEWLCRGDLGFIFAPRGVGKTWISMALPHAISAGLPLGKWQAGEEKASVLYLDGEMPLELSKSRHTWLKHDGGDVAYLHHDMLFEKIGRTLNIADPEHQQAITTLLIETGRNLLVLDNLSCLASGVDENKGLAYEPIAAWLLDLRRRKITVVMVHHAGREGFMRGHSKREDAASWIIELRDAKDEGQEGARFISHFAKPSRNTGHTIPDLLWHFTTDEAAARTEILCEPAEESEYETMLRHIKDGVDTVSDLAEQMGKGKGTISKWVKRGMDSGKIKRTTDKRILYGMG